MIDERDGGGGSSDEVDMYNEMLRLEEMESLLEEIEDSEADAAGLPPELQRRLDALNIADTHELRRSVEVMHTSLDTAE